MNDEITLRAQVAAAERVAKTRSGGQQPKLLPKEQKSAENQKVDGKQAEQIAQEVADGLNNLVQGLHRELQFAVDDKSGEMIIKVIDQETDEVVRQIPSEEVIRLRQRLEDAEGLIFSSSA